MTDATRQDRAAGKGSKGTSPRAGTEPRAGASPQTGTGTSRPDRLTVRSRPDRYLVTAVPPADVREITSQLEHDRSCRVVRTLGGPGSPGGFPRVAAVEMSAEHAAMLAAYPGVHVEPDYAAGRGRTHAVQPPAVVTQRVMFEVLDDSMRPIEGATVTLAGSGFPVTGFTGPDGRAEITATPEALTAPTAVEIRPPRGCWPVRVRRPLLGMTGPVRVVCTRITKTYPEFPERALDSWGARVMGFRRLHPRAVCAPGRQGRGGVAERDRMHRRRRRLRWGPVLAGCVAAGAGGRGDRAARHVPARGNRHGHPDRAADPRGLLCPRVQQRRPEPLSAGLLRPGRRGHFRPPAGQLRAAQRHRDRRRPRHCARGADPGPPSAVPAGTGQAQDDPGFRPARQAAGGDQGFVPPAPPARPDVDGRGDTRRGRRTQRRPVGHSPAAVPAVPRPGANPGRADAA